MNGDTLLTLGRPIHHRAISEGQLRLMRRSKALQPLPQHPLTSRACIDGHRGANHKYDGKFIMIRPAGDSLSFCIRVTSGELGPKPLSISIPGISYQRLQPLRLEPKLGCPTKEMRTRPQPAIIIAPSHITLFTFPHLLDYVFVCSAPFHCGTCQLTE